MSIKRAEDAHFDSLATKNDAEITLQWILERLMYNQLCHAVVEQLQHLIDDTVDTCSAIQDDWPFSEAC